ncbi:Uncharacterised protein [Helicobacter cinaedi]|uniref:Uncharacterized protein n=1 Tax=Helicobacter cinaedi TaxID=213 RepID=A0A377JT79_9HELI|nr:hypothetical protein [Helicobacter cinaedi]STP11190.1 Uncharacterised protein [Helicobacter cinaedi]
MRKSRILSLVLVVFMLFACSDDSKITQDSQPLPQKPKLELESSDNLDSIMDKILAYVVYEPSTQGKEQNNIEQDTSSSSSLSSPANVKGYLQKAYEMDNGVGSYQQIPETLHLIKKDLRERTAQNAITIDLVYELEIDTDLALLLVRQGSMQSLADLLLGQEKSAKESGSLAEVIEYQIQIRLLALYGLYHSQMGEASQQESLEDTLRFKAETQNYLKQYKDFLQPKHYELYDKALELFGDASLQGQMPIDRILQQLLTYSLIVQRERDMDGAETERLQKAYELFQIRDFSSPQAKEIVEITQNPLKNTYEEDEVGNYIYGLNYLTLAFLNENVSRNIETALEYLQKDFQFIQIQQHTFSATYFHNYITSMFVGAYILSGLHQDREYFENLLRRIQTELAQYDDVINEDDMNLYREMLALLEKTDREAFSSISFVESKPKDEDGFIKIRLDLSPQEMHKIKELMAKEQNTPQGEVFCLGVADVEFMLSLVYQAYKIQGYEGIAPDFFKIRMEEVFGVRDFSQMDKYFVDFDRFMVVGVADRKCYKQNLLIDERLGRLQEKQSVCGYSLFFDKENGIMTDEILPSILLEQVADGNVYFRLKVADLNLNRFIFQNNEEALKEFETMPHTSTILAILLESFPDFSSYLKGRIGKTENFLMKAKAKECEKP